MADETRRRRAGAEGAGDSDTPDPTKPADAKKAKPERTEEETVKVLWPKVAEFTVTRGTLFVPSEFTLGDMVQRGVLADWDAYCRLVVVEFHKVSGIDISVDGTAFFAPENAGYLMVALTTSNSLDFMRRVLRKSAYVVIEEDNEQKLPPSEADFNQLQEPQLISIGLDYLGRWIKARHEKNLQRAAAQT